MRWDYEQLFAHIDKLEPPAGLLDRIMTVIYEERQSQKTRLRVIGFSLLSIFSIAAMVPAWQELQAELLHTNFSQFASLLFSDWSTVTLYSQDFILSLVEALPVFGILMLLGSIFALLLSLRFITRDISAIFRQPKLAGV